VTLQEFRARLPLRDRGQHSGNGSWLDFCPAHYDREHHSLSVTERDGKILIKCFRGCSPEMIVRTLGLTLADLFVNGKGRRIAPTAGGRVVLTLDAFADAKSLPADFLAANGVVQDHRGLRINYYLEDRSPALRQRRRTAVAAKEGSSWDGPKAEKPVAYGLWRLDEAREKGELLAVEGETNVLSAWFHNVPALGIPGADMTRVLTAEALKGIDRIWILKDPDQGGETFIAGLGQRLEALGWPGQAFVVSLPVKDLNDLHRAHGASFAEELERAKAAATPLPRPEPRFRTIAWREMTSAPAAPIAWHWPGWVSLAAVALIVGAGESLKSWLALLLAIFTAAGRAPLVAAESEETDEARLAAGPVLYITGENSLDEERRRCAMLKAGLGLPDDLPITFVPAEALCLGTEEDYQCLLRLVEQLRPVAVFIDSAIALSGITDENANVEVRSFMRGRILPLARRHGATVYLIGHSPKPPKEAGARSLTNTSPVALGNGGTRPTSCSTSAAIRPLARAPSSSATRRCASAAATLRSGSTSRTSSRAAACAWSTAVPSTRSPARARQQASRAPSRPPSTRSRPHPADATGPSSRPRSPAPAPPRPPCGVPSTCCAASSHGRQVS
jgi:hypothetical protein